MFFQNSDKSLNKQQQKKDCEFSQDAVTELW